MKIEKLSEDLLYWTETFTNIEGYTKYFNINSSSFDYEEILLSDELLLQIEKKFIKKYDIIYSEFFTAIFSLYLSRIDKNEGSILKTSIFDESNDFKLNSLLKIEYNKNISFVDYIKYVSNLYDEVSIHTNKSIEDNALGISNLVFYSVNDFTDDVCKFQEDDSVLTLNIYQNKLEMRYNSSVFSSIYIQHMLCNLKAMVEDVLKSPYNLLKDIDILSDVEKDLINTFCKGGHVSFDENKTLGLAFRENALKNPNLIALDDGFNQISYGELENSTNIIANFLIDECGVGRGDIIGVMLPRDYHFPECVLALNKIGATFMPIDSQYPLKRIESMLDISETKYIITTRKYSNLPEFSVDLIYIEDFDVDNNDVVECREIVGNGDDLFSIVFTSGTTGLPKGVMFSNKQVACATAVLRNVYHSKPGDLCGCYVNFSFALSFRIFFSLYDGETCRIFNENEIKDPSLFLKVLNQNMFNDIFLPASLSVVFSEYGLDINVKYLLFAGSKLNNIPHIASNTKLFNIYGSSEVTLVVAALLDPNSNAILIGKPLDNFNVHILDENKLPVPIGVAGDLYVSSDCMSPGYINNSELTNEVFIDASEFSFESKSRFFSTGDVCFYNFDGNIEIVGRRDDQLSVRGFRVESDEILNIMKRFDGFSEIILNVVDDNLIAYYTVSEDIEIENVKKALKNELPFYMIPSTFIKLDEIPLNYNGKVDKSKLPKHVGFSENIKPKNDVEQELLQICYEILDFDDFGVTDNLLSMGFSSITFMKLNYEINSRFGITLDFIDLIECSTVHEIYYILNNVNSQLFKKYDKRILYPLTKNQKVVYQSRSKDLNAFKRYYSLKIVDVDVTKLRNSFIKAVNNHPFLKSSFINKDGITYIKRDDDEDISNLIKIYNLNKHDFDLFEKHIFELDTDFYDDYFKEGLTKYCDKFFYCVMVEHENNVIIRLLFDHLAFDFYSLSLLFYEIDKIYFDKENEIDEEIIDGFDYNMFIFNDEKQSNDFFEKYRNEVINYGDLFIPPVHEYDDDCCETDELSFKINKHPIQNFSNKHNIPYNQFFMATLVLTLHKFSSLNKGILPVISNGRFFNELMNIHHYIAKTIYFKFEFDKFHCLKDVFVHISDQMKQIIRMEPNSLYFVYNNQWLFNFIEINTDLNFNVTEIWGDKPSFIRNVGKNILNDIWVVDMNDSYNIFFKYHNKRYDKEYMSLFFDFWNEIMEFIISFDNINMDLDFLNEIYEKYNGGMKYV